MWTFDLVLSIEIYNNPWANKRKIDCYTTNSKRLDNVFEQRNIYKIYKSRSSPWKKNSHEKITHGQGGASFYTLDQY